MPFLALVGSIISQSNPGRVQGAPSKLCLGGSLCDLDPPGSSGEMFHKEHIVMTMRAIQYCDDT
jgi:hypothetical protein